MTTRKYLKNRRSGILAHITSLPSQYGIGDLGPETYSFLHFLRQAGQTLWQILPLGPTQDIFAHSPYMGASAFAGNPLLISPQLLKEDGLISESDIADHPPTSPYLVDFPKVVQFKQGLLATAFANTNHAFTKKSLQEELEIFRQSNKWVTDYAVFMALRKHYSDRPWFHWEREVIRRSPSTLKDISERLHESIRYYEFEQFIFHKQWNLLHRKAQDLGIGILGDIPIYVSLDSADVWANQEIFLLDTDGAPLHVAGVPPDYFSRTGQKWGNPLYRWNTDNEQVENRLITWWCDRFASVFNLVDIARIDHFRGFEAYWSIPAEEETAVNGTWEQGPGAGFFQKIIKNLGNLEIVAEDLGEITDNVLALRDQLGFPGMKVLQFAFDGNRHNSFLPFQFRTPNCVIYTGTHDNDTTVGWYLDSRMSEETRSRIKQYANRCLNDQTSIHTDLIYLAMSSIANTAIFPLQDILGFGSDCRMNTPGTTKGNWRWRCSKEFLTENIAEWLFSLTDRFDRFPAPDSPA